MINVNDYIVIDHGDEYPDFFIVRQIDGDYYLVENLGFIISEIYTTGVFRTFDAEEIDLKSYLEYHKDELEDASIFHFKESALSYLVKLIEERVKSVNG